MSKRVERVPEQVEIIDLTRDGRGVARADGKTLFVAGALPGETVTAVRMKRRRSHDEGQVIAAFLQGMTFKCLIRHQQKNAELFVTTTHYTRLR